MPYDIFNFVTTSGENIIKTWTQKLQPRQRAKLNERLDKLSQNGDELLPQTLSPTNIPSILKLRMTVGKVQLRPLLCRGTADPKKEYTLLLGATERDFKYDPPDADKTAGQHRQELIDTPSRRIKHERVK